MPRQARFVEEFTFSRNATSAAVKAGYSPKTARQIACENLTKPDIRATVAEHEQAVMARFAVSRELVITELVSAIDVARRKSDAGAMIAGWREVARICGFYSPERAVKGNISVATKCMIDQLETLPDAELMAMVASAKH